MAPTAPLDLDTMQSLIEQLAGQLSHAHAGDAPMNAVARPAMDLARLTFAAPPASRSSVQPTDVLAAPDHSGAAPRQPGWAAPTPAAGGPRGMAPYGHLALIAEAVEANRMDVFLDPILGLADRRARHFELSVRLLTSAGDDLAEDDYTRAAAGTGLLARIDAAKLARAADVLQRLRSRGSGASLFSAVAGESLADASFAEAFTDILATEEGHATRLVLTFAQSEARVFTAAHWRTVAAMSEIGLKFALAEVTDLDMDFELLRRHGFDFIKLDAAVFLDGLPTASGRIPADDICRHLAGLGLGLIVGGIVAEKDLARILGFGALLGQGMLFGGPRSVEIERERRAA